MKQKIFKCLGILAMTVGLIITLWPDIMTLYSDIQTRQYKFEFFNEYGLYVKDSNNTHEASETEDDDSTSIGMNGLPASFKFRSKENDALYQRIQEYNEDLFKSKQAKYTDAWVVTQNSIDLEDLGNSFGYINIPAMGITYPLYVGASEENMAKGCAIMGQTSLPIGGNNSNCVIVGHRGYSGIPYFMDIENLKVGDPIYIVNPWEKLTYKVSEVKIINPYASNEVMIQDGKDMVTLLTCHPYASHGKYRYAVYCERCNGDLDIESADHDTEEESDINSVIVSNDGSSNAIVEFESSAFSIALDRWLRRGIAGLIIILLIISLLGLI